MTSRSGSWALALLTATIVGACSKGGGSVSCGLAALTGPLTVKESFAQGSALAEPPSIAPAALPVRLVAGPAWRSAITQDGSRWRVAVLGTVSPLVRAGYGVLVIDPDGAPLGVLAFEGRAVTGAPKLGTLAMGNIMVPLLGVRIDRRAIENAACPIFPDSLR